MSGLVSGRVSIRTICTRQDDVRPTRCHSLQATCGQRRRFAECTGTRRDMLRLPSPDLSSLCATAHSAEMGAPRRRSYRAIGVHVPVVNSLLAVGRYLCTSRPCCFLGVSFPVCGVFLTETVLLTIRYAWPP